MYMYIRFHIARKKIYFYLYIYTELNNFCCYILNNANAIHIISVRKFSSKIS